MKLNATLLVMLLAVGCSPMTKDHGYTPEKAALDNIIVGVDSRVSVEEHLGPPTIATAQGGNHIFYVGSTWRHFAFTRPRPTKRQIVAISFDGSDTVSNVARYKLEDGELIALSRRVTDGGTKEITAISQILSSLNQFDAAAVFGQ